MEDDEDENEDDEDEDDENDESEVEEPVIRRQPKSSKVITRSPHKQTQKVRTQQPPLPREKSIPLEGSIPPLEESIPPFEESASQPPVEDSTQPPKESTPLPRPGRNNRV